MTEAPDRIRYAASGGDIGEAFGGASLAFLVAILVIAIYLVIKAIDLIVRVFAKYPKNKALWIAFGIFVLCCFLAGSMKGNAAFLILTGMSFLILVLTARIVELYYSDIFQEQTTVVESVLRKPWFGTQNKAAA